MSDWSSRHSLPLRSLLIGALVVACASTLFLAGRWSAPRAAANQPADAPMGSVMLPVGDDGIPHGYAQTEDGARAAAVNTVIAGLWLRRGFGSADLGAALEARGLPGNDHPESNATRMLLNKDAARCASMDNGTPPTCTGGHDANPQTAIYDFAPPPARAGILAAASIATKPTATVSPDGSTATVTLRWAEKRTAVDDAARMPDIVTDFTLHLIWQDDWKLLPDGVDAVATRAAVAPGAWLDVVGFIGQAQ